MNFNFVRHFQTSVYNLLSSDTQIQQLVDQVYITIVQDARYPFLCIRIKKIENYSKFDQTIYNIEFEVCIFAKDSSHALITEIASLIITRLNKDALNVEGYTIAGLKNQEIRTTPSQDLVTHKLSIIYKTTIKELVI